MSYGFVVTDQGVALLTSLLKGDTLTLTKVCVGDGDIALGDDPHTYTDLVSPKYLATSSIPVVDGNSASLVVQYRNDMNGGLPSEFWLREFGIYADDGAGNDILLYYASLGASAQKVVPYAPDSIDIKSFPVKIVTSDEINVTVNYPLGAWMTAEDVKDYVDSQIEKVTELALGAHIGIVFNTTADFTAWLADPAAHPRPDNLLPSDLKIGESIFTIASGDPDYWWDGTTYHVLDVDIDLANYYNKQEVNSLTDGKEPLIKNAAAKTTLVDADTIPLSDSAASNATKKITWANIKAALKTYFDTLYSRVVVNNTLTSTSTTEALSAAQGRELKALNDGKEPLVKNAATKATLANADTFVISDSADSNNTKKISWSTISGIINGMYGSASVAATLTTGGWNVSKEQTVAVSGLTTSSIAAVGLAVNATDAQYEAASNAKIRVVSQVSGSFTVRCMGTTPIVSIPIVVNVSQW